MLRKARLKYRASSNPTIRAASPMVEKSPLSRMALACANRRSVTYRLGLTPKRERKILRKYVSDMPQRV